jgi:hypothetical protein
MLLLALTAISASGGLSNIEALSMIETGDNDGAVGRAGEVSRFQIRPAVWRQYTQSTAYDNSRIASMVAQKHLLFLASIFRDRTGREPGEFDLYVLWNAGAGYYERLGFSADRVNRVIRDRAQRYFNLCHMQNSQLFYTARPADARLQPEVRP